MNRTILLVEDEPMLRELMHLELMGHGFEVTLARNGQEAIDVIGDCVPDLILLDLLMPKVDGYGVLSYLQEQGIATPVIILSNLSDTEEWEKCRQLGAQEFLVKNNFDSVELWGKVEKYLLSPAVNR